MSENIREIVFDCLVETDINEKKSHLVMRDVLDKYDYLDNVDKNFIKKLFEGTVQKRITLDYALNFVMKKPLEKNKPEVIEILRMGAYQILFMDRVPDSAACDEAVKLLKKRSRPELSGFVNASLRSVSRMKDSILAFDSIEDEAKRWSVKYSVPEWIVRMLNKEQKKGEALIASFDRERPTFVRIVKKERESLITKEWEKAGVSFEKSNRFDCVYKVSDFHGINELFGFDTGDLYIQDESSMISVSSAFKEGYISEDKFEKLRVLDMCAAPGGKSVYTSELLKGKGSILSLDVSEQKVSLLKDNIERLSIANMECDVWDATIKNESFVDGFDLVICDVPCSGLGVMARKSDIKYRISNESMISLCQLQKAIVDNALLYVKKGGILLYSTCTMHKAENEKMVKYIVNNGDYVLLEDKQLIPSEDDTDGFYFAVLKRN